jgi:EAL domain-containing protein (putative c-di-GMP-specific phosphodiesterase class I)/GGDEF domain-containing protein
MTSSDAPSMDGSKVTGQLPGEEWIRSQLANWRPQGRNPIQLHDPIAQLLCDLAGSSHAVLNLFDSDQRCWRMCSGAPLLGALAFSGQVILQRRPLLVGDIQVDPRFRHHPALRLDPDLRSYLGVPLIGENGAVSGSLCVFDPRPHAIGAAAITSIERLAHLLIQRLELIRDESSCASTSVVAPPRLLGRDQGIRILEALAGLEVDACYAVMRAELKDYDRISATLGGKVAAELMEKVARLLHQAIPEEASLARFSDSEFLLILPHVSCREQATAITDRVLERIHGAFQGSPESLPLSLAIGITMVSGQGDSADSILADARMARRLASHGSGSNYRFADAQVRRQLQDDYAFEARFLAAIRDQELLPVFQPIIDLASSRPIGFEVLARWQDGDKLIRPSQFLPIAQRSGFTGDLDLQIITKALAAISELSPDSRWSSLILSVNLSAQLLNNVELRDRLIELLSQSPLPPRWQLQVEILEDDLGEHCAGLDTFLNRLSQLQVGIAIDDFGTGYSSLSRLNNLPIQLFKLDPSLIHQIDDDLTPSNRLLLTVQRLARDLGLGVTAEGVETEGQRRWLQSVGFLQAQGYHFAHPMNIEDTQRWLAHCA